MGLTRKPVTVHFFGVDAEEQVIGKLSATFTSLRKLGSGTDIVNLPQSRFLLRYIADSLQSNPSLLFWSTVKERNTWQVRSKRDGSLSALQDSNSIVGDPSFYKFDPARKILAAFTTFSATGYLKSMCNSVFRRLLPRSSSFTIDYLTDDQTVTQVRNWDYYSRISIKLDTRNISESEEKPDLIKALLNLKDVFGGDTISVTLDSGQDRLPKQDVTETINYLSSNESCESLRVAGGTFDGDERDLTINLKRAFVTYKTSIELRANQRYINISDADRILSDAFDQTRLPSLRL